MEEPCATCAASNLLTSPMKALPGDTCSLCWMRRLEQEGSPIFDLSSIAALNLLCDRLKEIAVGTINSTGGANDSENAQGRVCKSRRKAGVPRILDVESSEVSIECLTSRRRTMNSKPEWIDANQALLVVEKVLNGRGDAKSAIAECLRDGDVRAMASERWISRAKLISDAWSADAPRLNYRTDALIECKSFRASKCWSLDQDEWRWPFNKFSISIKTSPSRRRHMFAGVKLNRLDLERVILRRNPTGVGSPGKPEQWVALWHALIEMERSDRLNATTFPSIESLEAAVLGEIDDGLSSKSIGPTISQVWRKFAEGRAAQGSHNHIQHQ